MDNNWFLGGELARMRRDEIAQELAHERFLQEHGLDLWSVVRRAIRDRLRRQQRSVEVARAPRPLHAPHRPLARRTDLIEPQPAGPGGDVRDTAA